MMTMRPAIDGHRIASLLNGAKRVKLVRMKAIRVHQFGDPSVMTLEEIPDPAPASGQMLVKIKAAGVNPVDTYIRAGTYGALPAVPYTPGADPAGTDRGRALVTEQGADDVFDHTSADYQKQIMAKTDGKGVDLVIEMLANVNLVRDLEMLAMRGRVVIVGNRGAIEINPRSIMS